MGRERERERERERVCVLMCASWLCGVIASACFQVLDRLADGMVFGALRPCPECGGQLLIRSHCYQCTGNMSAWSKCAYTTSDPQRAKWVIPQELRDDVPFL